MRFNDASVLTPAAYPLFIDWLRGRAARLPATALLVAANCAVFVAMLYAGAGLWHTSNEVQLNWGANFGPATQDGEWWRLATAMFLHFGLLHLAVNMVALVEAGRYAERIFGSWRFMLLYFGSGLAGNLLSLAVQGNHGISGGASGAVFGIYGALLTALWCERRALAKAEFCWLFGGVAGFSAINIALGLTITGIDNGAHLGGLLFGALAALAVERVHLRTPRLSWSVRGAAGLLLASGIACLAMLMPAPSYDWSDEQSARSGIRSFISEDADISAQWNAIFAQGQRDGMSFEDLAMHIDSQVAGRYEASFEQLAALHVDPRAPSARTLDMLRRYADARRAASHELADALRARDASRIRQAIDKAKSAGAATSHPPTLRQPAGTSQQ